MLCSTQEAISRKDCLMDIIIQICGWVGTVLIVGAYFLNSRGYVRAQSKGYQLMNLAGSVGVFVNVWHQRAWPAVALQVTWAIIALWSLATMPRGNKKSRPSGSH